MPNKNNNFIQKIMSTNNSTMSNTRNNTNGFGMRLTEVPNEILENKRKEFTIFEPKEAISLLEFKPGSKIVDLGSGQGHFVLELAKILDDKSQIYGVDVQKSLLIKMLKEAKQLGYKNVFAVWDDLDEAVELKIPNSSFDYVFIVNTLFQLENPKNALLLAYKLLKKGGKLIIIEWNNNPERKIGPSKEHTINKDWLLKELEDLGFVFESEYRLGRYHYMLVLIK